MNAHQVELVGVGGVWFRDEDDFLLRLQVSKPDERLMSRHHFT